jgi:hypothetical protein
MEMFPLTKGLPTPRPFCFAFTCIGSQQIQGGFCLIIRPSWLVLYVSQIRELGLTWEVRNAFRRAARSTAWFAKRELREEPEAGLSPSANNAPLLRLLDREFLSCVTALL